MSHVAKADYRLDKAARAVIQTDAYNNVRVATVDHDDWKVLLNAFTALAIDKTMTSESRADCVYLLLSLAFSYWED